MGTRDLRVQGKIFATLPSARHTVNIKATPTNLDALVQADPKTYRDVWGGRWVGVDLTRVTRPELADLLADAWRLTAPKGLIKTHESTRPRSSDR